MIRIEDIKHIYFIGIGGIGMSALARYFRSLGILVSGYDRARTPLTATLEAEGMAIHYVDQVELAPKDIQAVVYTPAIPADHSELGYYRAHAYPVLKRSDVLQIISAHAYNICVAGTHGKTTISTMTAHLLRATGYGCNAFLGGISSNYQTNFWSHERNVCVIEADEYDRSFLKLSPDIAIISAMDPDHLDIYGTAEAMEESYIEFAKKIRNNGRLFIRKGLSQEAALTGPQTRTYSLTDPDADICVQDLRIVDGSYTFAIRNGDQQLNELVLNVGGAHNVENMAVAIAVAMELEIEGEKIREAVAAYSGVKRRFEYGVRTQQRVYIDDYAHHPEELNALIGSVRRLYPERRLVVVFQPHLFSRTNDFADGFAAVLDKADEVYLLPIYPAREKPMPGVTSSLIADRMKDAQVQILEKEEMLELLGQKDEEWKDGVVLVTAGAGDIDRMVEPLKTSWNQ